MIPKNLGIVNSIKEFKNQTSNKVPEGEIKIWNKGKPNMVGSSVNVPGRNKAFAKAGAIAAAVASTIPVGKIVDKWDQFVETTPFLKNLLK
jgi:hypothetical protein